MRSPKWHRDEIILALDLYFKLEPGQIHSRNPLIVELSETLNKLPIFHEKPNNDKFRNANGASMKLSNFLALDDNYSGIGMKSYSKKDLELFSEFSEDRGLLSNLAKKIKLTVANKDILQNLALIEEDMDDVAAEVKEGKILYKLHKYRERNKAFISKKKDAYRKVFGNIACEDCGFDFEETYGELGYDFIECHHIIPLLA